MVEHSLLSNGMAPNPATAASSDFQQQIVPRDSPQYRAFIKKIEVNCAKADTKLSVCLLCWGFLSYFQKKRHQEHSHYTVTPIYFKSEELFLNLARKHGKMYDNESRVAIFADTVPIQQAGAFGSGSNMGQGGPKPGMLVGNFGPSLGTKGAASQVQELRMVSQKQIEHEQHIKRLNQIINSLCEESKIKDRRIKQLEATFVSIQQQLCPQSSVSRRTGVMSEIVNGGSKDKNNSLSAQNNNQTTKQQNARSAGGRGANYDDSTNDVTL